jgi:hypothetical protein
VRSGVDRNPFHGSFHVLSSKSSVRKYVAISASNAQYRVASFTRGCETVDVMGAIYYLIEQQYETGQALPVTGGQVMLP